MGRPLLAVTTLIAASIQIPIPQPNRSFPATRAPLGAGGRSVFRAISEDETVAMNLSYPTYTHIARKNLHSQNRQFFALLEGVW
jgi:hypothetical protein